jgi:biopolymer transport protein ExbB
MISIFNNGGPIMWPLLLTSIVALAVVVERLIFAFGEKRSRNREAVHKIFQSVEAGQFDAAIKLGEKSPDLVARVMAYGLSNRADSLANALMVSAGEELKRYKRGLPVLDTVITLAPLLGLLGTITGMIHAFGLLGAQQLGAPTEITGGIAQALIATAFGLGIAITALLPFNYLNSQLDDVRHEIENAATRLEIKLERRRESKEGTP